MPTASLTGADGLTGAAGAEVAVSQVIILSNFSLTVFDRLARAAYNTFSWKMFFADAHQLFDQPEILGQLCRHTLW